MAITEALNNLFRRIPWKAWLAVGGLLAGAFWMHQHDARIRRQARLQQLRNQTSAQVSALRRQAAQAVKQANVENTKVLQELEQRRQQAVEQNRQLAAQLARLREQAQIQAGEVATLPISKIVTRVAAQLGLKAEDVMPDVETDLAKNETAGEKTPHPAAGASTLSPRRGPGSQQSADSTKNATAGPGDAGSRGALGAPAAGQSPPLQNTAVLSLTSSGARKVETALIALKACRAENDIETQQISNCQVRAEAGEAEVKRLQSSVAGLNRALDAKDKILALQQSESKAELRAARGTFLGRLAHAAEHVAIGVAVGVAIGVAVK
ncbi:MAG: hypothetical protein WB819_04740 [Terriglobia bacterium]